MENTGLSKNKGRNMIFGLLCVLLMAQSFPVLYAGRLLPDDFKVSEYFEKTKNEILQDRKFRDQSTPANALLTLI